jgi:hypothetical protein
MPKPTYYSVRTRLRLSRMPQFHRRLVQGYLSTSTASIGSPPGSPGNTFAGRAPWNRVYVGVVP